MNIPGWLRPHRDEELDEELQGHLRMAIEDRVDPGHPGLRRDPPVSYARPFLESD